MVFPLSTLLAMHTPALSTGPLNRGMATEQSFDDTPEAMSSLVPSPGEQRDGRGHQDDVTASVLVSQSRK